MPKQTFFHLPEGKRKTLICAAKKEFARVPLHEASVANIVKEAGIPRGSFYQYFDGKEDLYYYLLNEMSEVNHAHFIQFLKENKGDLFDTFIQFFRFVIENDTSEQERNFHKHAFLNMNYKIKNILANNLYEENRIKHYQSIIQKMDMSPLNVKNDDDIYQLYTIILSVTFHNFVQVFVKDLSIEAALKDYEKQMNLLKIGLWKGD